MLQVTKKCCGQCLFSSKKIVSDERKEGLLSDIEANDSYFVCHKASQKNKDIVCRGFFENKTSNMIRVASRLRMIEFVEESSF